MKPTKPAASEVPDEIVDQQLVAEHFLRLKRVFGALDLLLDLGLDRAQSFVQITSRTIEFFLDARDLFLFRRHTIPFQSSDPVPSAAPSKSPMEADSLEPSRIATWISNARMVNPPVRRAPGRRGWSAAAATATAGHRLFRYLIGQNLALEAMRFPSRVAAPRIRPCRTHGGRSQLERRRDDLRGELAPPRRKRECQSD